MRGSWILLALITSACAQPKYVDPKATAAQASLAQAAADCRIQFAASAYCVSWQWKEAPPRTGDPAEIYFKIFRKNKFDGSPVPVETNPEVALWMEMGAGTGHGSAQVVVTRLDVGTFSAANLSFYMPGTWQIKFQIALGDGITDVAVAQVDIDHNS